MASANPTLPRTASWLGRLSSMAHGLFRKLHRAVFESTGPTITPTLTGADPQRYALRQAANALTANTLAVPK